MHEEKETEESEKPINLDDAMKELDEKIALVKERGTWEGVDVDKYMDEVRGRVSDDLEEAAEEYCLATEMESPYVRRLKGKAFISGARWQKEQMVKEAVEGFIFQAEDYYPKELIARYDGELKHGDKVRIIIVKE